ncbi:MAG: ABC transporter ATP-binding protein [Promethearchaeota archaeon]
MQVPVVECKDLYKEYDVGAIKIHAIRGINLKIQKGEFVSLMGPSGCGKTTLLNLIGALTYPTSGQTLLNGVDTTKMRERERTHIRRLKVGFIFQFYSLMPMLSAWENVELPMLIAGVPRAERRQRTDELLNAVEIDHRRDSRPDQLSGGEKQRVAIARSLANNPPLLLADEPTGDLDSEAGQSIIDLLLKLNQEENQTIFLVTHDISIAKTASRLLMISDGQIIKDISPPI